MNLIPPSVTIILLLAYLQSDLVQGDSGLQSRSSFSDNQQVSQANSLRNQTEHKSFFERLRTETFGGKPNSNKDEPQAVSSFANNQNSSQTAITPTESSDDAEDSTEDGEDDDDGDDEEDSKADEEEDEDDEDDEDVAAIKANDKQAQALQKGGPKVLSDMFGNKIKLENNRTILLSQNKGRDLGLLTIKALLLGPLIGLTIKAALIRGLLWAIGAYVLHLFFPSLLSTLGLGTGLVGFARQLHQPDYAQMLLPSLAELPASLMPASIQRLAQQYRQLFSPVVESIRSIPEGHCRYRAVCETASYIIRNSQQSMSTSIQRLSATVYLNFGTEYSKAWLDGIVQSDCAAKYNQCSASPFSMIATRLADTLRNPTKSA